MVGGRWPVDSRRSPALSDYCPPTTMEYLDKLKQLTAWDAEPALTEDDLDELLIGASLMDAGGLAPLNEEWTPTYDLNAAAAQGWLIKAARAASLTDEPTAGTVTSRVFENCRAMARIYAGKRSRSINVS